MSKKRRRESSGVDTEVVEIYEDLANEDEEVRLRAAKALLSRVLPDNNPSNEELEKILKRLFRGLCSSRKAARLGFSVALTEFLVQGSARCQASDQAQDISAIIDTLEAQTRIPVHVSGQEERDHYFGRLFGADAILQSGILSLSNSSTSHLERLLELVFELAKKKSWLREECGWILCTALKSPRPMSIDNAQLFVDKLYACGLAKTPEGVALWITARFAYPDIQFPKHVWRHQDPLHRKETALLARILKETTIRESEDTKKKDVQRGNWKAKLHFAWDVVFGSLLKHGQKQMSLGQLWQEAVDDGLFATSSSDERKYWGFLIFQKFVTTFPVNEMLNLLSHNLRRCLVNQLASSERFLHRAAERSLRAIHSRAEKDPEVASVVVRDFAQNMVNFDVLTKTKTIEKLISQADPKDLRSIVHDFIEVIVRPHVQDERAAAATRQLSADYLVFAVRSRVILNASESSVALYRDFVSLITESLIKYAYFEPVPDMQHTTSLPISVASREMLKTRLTTCVSLLVLKSDNPAYYPHQVLSFIRSCESRPQVFRSLISLGSNSDIAETVHKGWDTIDWLDKEELTADASRLNYLRAFKLLYTLTILQIYNGDTEAVGMIQDLQGCFEALFVSTSRTDRGLGAETLVEVILSLVSRPSLLFKRLAQQVFSACTSLVSDIALQSMVDVLQTRETISGQQETFEQDGSESAISDVEMSDVEEIGAQHAGNHDASTTSDSEVSSVKEQDHVDNSESTDDELAEFDAKLAQALGTRPLDKDRGTNEKSSDEDMDDDQMEALDAQLETVFRERKKLASKKSEKKEAKETIVLFKARVLELLEIYIKEQYLNPLALDLLIPLLTVIRTTSSKQVSEKAYALIREYSKLYKLKDRLDSEAKLGPIMMTTLNSIHELATKEGSNAYSNACSQASLLVAKIHIANGGDPAEVLTRYAETQLKFIKEP
ncbi:DNA-directed DNA polymerase, partial [Lambiella insularis]|nr:DNA-directed DNA polymerase [Lambiella insularis]